MHKQKIISAAIMTPNGVILTMPKPYRHHHILNNSNVHQSCNGNEIQGFLAYDEHFNNIMFVDRQKASVIAGIDKDILFSEDLW